MKHSAVQVLLSAVLCAIIIFTIPSSAAAGAVYVKWDSPGAGTPGTFDGQSWDTAFHKVQEGLNAALSGDEVWVAAGTYVENVTLKSGVGLYGGFAGNETTRTQRNWKTNLSVLDGNKGHVVVTVASGATSTAVVDGFILQNGRGEGSGVSCSMSSPTIANNTITKNSCGIYCLTSSAVIVQNTITANQSSGIRCTSSSPTITNNTINGNTGSNGGGIYCKSSSPTITNNVIAFNTSGVYQTGGTPLLNSNCVYGNSDYNYSGLAAGVGDISADPKFVSAEYNQTHIQPGSPCIDAGHDSAVGTDWLDIDGQSRIHGAHVDIGADESDGTTWTYSPIIVRVSPNGNDANDGSTWALAKKTVQTGADAASLVGGEVWVAAGTYRESVVLGTCAYLYGGFAGTESSRGSRNWRSNPTIIDGKTIGIPLGKRGVAVSAGHKLNCIDGFTIRNAWSDLGGGISCRYSSPTITNNTIDNCHSSAGGGIYCYGSSPTIANNTIIRCGAGRGGAIYCISSSPTIANNTITECGATYGGAIYCSGASPTIANNIIARNEYGLYNEIITGATGTPVLLNNCLYRNYQDYSGLTAGPGDIASDPLFVDRMSGDYHLKASSPCINKGLNSAVGTGWLDMEGDPRILSGTVDMGADEYWSLKLSAREVKNAPDGAVIKCGATPVSANWPDLFYLEAEDRSGGIRVDKAGHQAVRDGKASILGQVQTGDNGERYIAADTVTPEAGTGVVKPLSLANRQVGGGIAGLQDGVWSWDTVKIPGDGYTTIWVQSAGMNNIGLLVTTFGTVTFAGDGFFYLDDGSALNDLSGPIGVKVSAAGLTIPSSGFVTVTGISSCEKNAEGKLLRLIKVRTQDDIVTH